MKDERLDSGGDIKEVITPRQALIYAAIVGWKGDEPPNPWYCPASIDDILAWAKSHFTGSSDLLMPAFKELEEEGLFFEIHKGLFDPPCYFCSYKIKFLTEISEREDYIDYWATFAMDNNECSDTKKWRKNGICSGQGSQGPSYWGVCIGSSCCWLEDRNECKHGLRIKAKQGDKRL